MRHVSILAAIMFLVFGTACDLQSETEPSENEPIDLSELTVSSPDCDIFSLPWMTVDTGSPDIAGPVFNVVDIGPDGNIYWNDSPIDDDTFAEYVEITTSMLSPPSTELILEADDNCQRVAGTITELEKIGYHTAIYDTGSWVFEPTARRIRPNETGLQNSRARTAAENN